MFQTSSYPVRLMSTLALCALAAAAAPSRAHDTWFQRQPEATPERPVHVLGTGNQFPIYDSRNEFKLLVRTGCRAGSSPSRPLEEVKHAPDSLAVNTEEALRLRPAQDLPREPRISCWAQQQPMDIEFDDDLVEAYFKESQPTAAVRQAWAAQKARGQRWLERYTKHARVEWFPDPEASASAAPERSDMDMDALMLAPLRAPRAGDEAEFVVLKNGQPMAQFPVEFRQHASRFGLWRRTDEQGRVRLRLPSAGRWLLRGIEITPPGAQADARWQGLFIALSFDVLPAR